MSGNDRERNASISAVNLAFLEANPILRSNASDFSDAESDTSTLSESNLSTYLDRKAARDGQQSLTDMANACIAFLNSPALDPWAESWDFNPEHYLAVFSSIPLVQDPRQIFGHPSDRTIIFGKKDANGFIAPIPLLRCLQLEGTSKFDSPNESVFERVALKQFMFKVTWPGCNTWQRDLLEEFTSELDAGMQITREILASLIAKEYQLFALFNGLVKADEYFYGALLANPPEGSYIGPGGVDFYTMNIAYVVQGQDGVWYADKGLVVSLPK